MLTETWSPNGHLFSSQAMKAERMRAGADRIESAETQGENMSLMRLSELTAGRAWQERHWRVETAEEMAAVFERTPAAAEGVLSIDWGRQLTPFFV